MNHSDTYTELIAKHLSGGTTPGEQGALFAWMEEDAANKKFFEEMAKAWAMTEGADLPAFETDMATAWAKVDAATPTPATTANTSARIRPLSKTFRRWSVAAAILLALGALWWLMREAAQPQFVEVRTAEHEKQEVILPDRSHVWLNGQSTIVYEAGFAQRKITLEGEAFFEVKRDEARPFEITGGEMKTTVLGTSFNVRAYPSEGQVEVTVKSGKVAFGVTKQGVQSVILPAGSSGIFDKKEAKLVAGESKMANADAWKTLRLDFDDVLMKDVILTLERYFGVDIEVANPLILQCHSNARFDEPDLDNILTVLAGTFDLEVKRSGNSYLLSGQGCH